MSYTSAPKSLTQTQAFYATRNRADEPENREKRTCAHAYWLES